jgi:glycosyltransferase 2 family protein
VSMVAADEVMSPGVAEREVRYVRSPSDLLRLVIALVVVAIGLLVTFAARGPLGDLERAVLALFDGLPGVLRRFLVGLIQLVAIIAPVATAITLAVLRRWRTLLLALLAGVVADLLVYGVERAANRIRPASLDAAKDADSWIAGAAYPSSAYLAGIAAAVTVVAPAMPRRWRRWAWGALGVVALGRVVSGTGLAIDLVAAVAAGWAVGLVVLLVFGVPDRRPSGASVRAALEDSGLAITGLRAAHVDARGSTPYFADLGDGAVVFVKVVSSEERSADLLFRMYRAVRLENVGDERPFSSLRRSVEHEALLSLRASSLGVRTPGFLGLGRIDDGSMVLAYEALDARSLADVADDVLTDDLLAGIWAQVERLHRRRVAHRDLRLANIMLARDGSPWIIDFGFSELAASDELLATDVAELIMSTALKVGPARAAQAAVDGVGRDAVVRAAPRLQPLALSGATRAAVHRRKGFDAQVRDAVASASGTGPVELERVERVSPRALLLLLFGGIASYVLIHQLTDVGNLVEQVGDLDWAWVPAIIFLSFLSYVGAALSLAGSVPRRLPAWPTFLSQLSGSFANRVTPVKVGGMAVGIRFLQKAGVDPPVAVTGVGLVSLFGFVDHVTLTVIFALFAGQEGIGDVDLPSDQTVLAVLAGVMVLCGVVLLLPIGRRLALDKLVPVLRRGLQGVQQVAANPSKLFTLIGGGLLVTLSYLFCLYFSLQAFGGGGIGLATVGVVYLTGSALAQTAPTPGGVGAVEAVLIAGLTAVGVDKEIAVPSVFLFRLATFWLPVLPGWLAFHHLTRRGML